MFIYIDSLYGCERDGTLESGCRRRFTRYQQNKYKSFSPHDGR